MGLLKGVLPSPERGDLDFARELAYICCRNENTKLKKQLVVVRNKGCEQLRFF